MSQNRLKNIYDCHTECQEFSLGDQVLTLMPIVGSPFQAKYTSLYTVTKKISDLNYLIVMPGWKKSTQLCHVNSFKPYYKCDTDLGQAVKNGMRPAIVVSQMLEPKDIKWLFEKGSLCNLDKLSESKYSELSELVQRYTYLYGDTPSRTDWIEYDIDVGDAQPI